VEISTIPFCVSWLARVMRTRFDARARSMGLTRAQWSMIAAIRLSPGLMQAELASQLEINSVTAGRIIDKLEAAGWVERRADPADRRAYRMYLRDKAQPTLASLGEIAAEELAVAMRGISAEEQAVFLDLLKRTIANLTGQEATFTLPESAAASE